MVASYGIYSSLQKTKELSMIAKADMEALALTENFIATHCFVRYWKTVIVRRITRVPHHEDSTSGEPGMREYELPASRRGLFSTKSSMCFIAPFYRRYCASRCISSGRCFSSPRTIPVTGDCSPKNISSGKYGFIQKSNRFISNSLVSNKAISYLCFAIINSLKIW